MIHYAGHSVFHDKGAHIRHRLIITTDIEGFSPPGPVDPHAVQFKGGTFKKADKCLYLAPWVSFIFLKLSISIMAM